MLRIFISLIPVFSFLGMLVFLDNYKLLKLSIISKAIGFGVFVAVICYLINAGSLNLVGERALSLYLAPVIEEFCKALLPYYLIRKGKVGFLVDAAIIGFAVGSGFALLENIYYLYQLESSNIMLWIFRGFGTAIMHGGNTAIFALISVYITGKHKQIKLYYFLPGLLAAIIIHSFFNHFFLSPMINTLLQVVGLPILLIGLFSYSEKGMKNWLQSGFDSDVKMLGFLKSGNFSSTKQGQYLAGFRNVFSGEVVLDLFCYLRVYLELAIRAKGVLLLRETGMNLPADEEIKAKFAEIKYLEKSIGKAGMTVLKPLLHSSQKELWQIYFLAVQG
ncbi:MAG: PrsW family intramembrane metalloprotease [Candidatus Cloacimonetes bacterium]|nr:PrsW family intramembrane metalloprotease [Candidatus Cloacimonadota bacterium]MCF7815062.1 PrsW family intramembrane metalloprotease [Candidatus Cloacimonadota bacterium]MCF7867992.1 PrsW family intramembrane metalloprotease [Candidatus Cloacimonadota bacterium]MCF7883450.1 PrsW family intramembrane metalloprotease [Candidatus Cloacimonadota bacterium]